MRLVASGHNQRIAVAAFLQALSGSRPLDVFQNGAILQADATHFDPTSGQLLELSGKRVVASVDEAEAPGISLNTGGCSNCRQVTVSNEPISYCVSCGEAFAADRITSLEVEAAEELPGEAPKEEELELTGETEASFDDENAEGIPEDEVNASGVEGAADAEAEEEESLDDGGWYEPGEPVTIPEDKDSKENATAAPSGIEDEAPESAEAGDDDTAPDYSQHTKQFEDVSMKKIKATASTKKGAASAFVRKLIAGMGKKALASEGQILTASDVLFASCPKCTHFTLSSEDFHDLAGGVLACGNPTCNHSITAANIGLTNLTVDPSHKATAGEGEGEDDAPPAAEGNEGGGEGEDDAPPAAEGGEDEDDAPPADDEEEYPEDEFEDESEDESEDEESGEDDALPVDDEIGDETVEEGMPEDETSEDDDAGNEEAPMAEGDGEIVDEFQATDGEDDSAPEELEEIDLLESTEVDEGDEVEVAFSSAANRAPHWNLSVAGAVIASLRKDAVRGPLASMAQDSFAKQKFAIAIRTALGSNVTKAAKALGFTGVTIKSPIANHVKAKVAAATKASNDALAAKEKSLASQVRESLVVVAAGLNRGFFGAVPHPMRTSVYTALSNARVPGAARIANAAFAERGEDYAKTLVSLAFEHMAKPAEARNEIAKSILGMGYQAIAEEDAPEDQEFGEMPDGTSVPNEEFMDRLEQGFDTAGTRDVAVASGGSTLAERIRKLKF